MSYNTLLNPNDSSDYQTAMQQLHATFARPIAIYQTALETIIYSNPNHNFLFPSTSNNTGINTQVVPTVSSGIYQARIHYEKEQPTTILANSEISVERQEQINVKNKIGKVKIILDATGFAAVQTCTRVQFDGNIFQVRSDSRPHGVVGVYFYNLYLTPLS